MTIFFTNLRRIFKKKVNRITIFLAPIVFIILSFSLITPGTIHVAVADKDNTEFSRAFIEGLKEKADVGVISEENMKTGVYNKTIDYGIVIDKGFTDSLVKGEDVKIESFRAEGAGVTSIVKLYIENYISAAKNIAKNANGNSEAFYSSFKDYEKGTFNSENIVFGNTQGDGKKEKMALGMLGYAMLLIATFSTNMILEDKKNNTYTRMFSTPLKNWNYMLQNILSMLVVVIIQVAVAFLFMTGVFKAQLGASVLSLFLIYTIFAACSVALALAIASVSKNVKQASVLGLLINTLAGMVGGFFWPKDYMPSTLLTIGKLTPGYWLTDGVDKLLTSPSITSAAQDIGIILLFTLAFFMASSWKKVYIENI